jgi:tRNA/tmRNA/rRNA uracil-C5-methylase (TrmA/RlmC/RlmD family)
VSPALADCPHRPPCPGCPRWGESGVPPEAGQSLRALARDAGLAEPPLFEGPPLGFRTRARLAVRGRPGNPKLGIFQSGTHRIADIPRCSVHHPRVNAVAAALKQALRASGLAPYAEPSGRGLVRYAQIAIERARGRAQLVIVTHGASPDPVRALAMELVAQLGDGLSGIWWNGNESRGNAILGPHWELLSGEPLLRETIAGTPVFFPPGAFAQSNLDLAERMVARVRELVPRDARVAELYAGTGSIGLGLLARCRELAMNELEPCALHGLEAGLAEQPAELRGRARVFAGRAGEQLAALAHADLVIVDPPRKGLDRELLEQLCTRPRGQLVYLSCGLPALLRESEQLRAAGWKLGLLETWALFPHTPHVETLACFEAGSA